MKLPLKLVWSQMLHQPARVVLTGLAMVAAACMVVWVVSGYDALVAEFDSFSDEYLGRYDVVISPPAVESPSYAPAQTVPPRYLPQTLLADVQADPSVALAEPVLQARLMVAGPGGLRGLVHRGGGGPPGARDPSARPRADDAPSVAPAPPERRPFGLVNTPLLVGTIATHPPHEMIEGRWIDIDAADRLEAVITKESARSLDVSLGQRVLVSDGRTDYRLTIVGVVEQIDQPGGNIRLTRASQQGPASAAIYVPMALAERISGVAGRVSFIQIVLREGVGPDAFRQRWAGRLAELESPGVVLTMQDIRSGLNEEYVATNARGQAYGATGMALVAGLFIVFTTLSMGVGERSRQLAVLRAVALTRGQIAMIVLVESLLLAILSWMGGLAAGWGLLKIVSGYEPAAGEGTVTLGAWSIALSGLCAVGGALLAAILPMRRAAAVDPLEAMAGRAASAPSGRLPIFTTIAGLLLIAVNPLLVFVIPMPDRMRYESWVSALGWGAMAVGFVLLMPLAVVLTERFIGPAVARLLRLNPKLVETELSRNLWQTVGTAAALSVGLGLFFSLQVWGYSMLNPFVPGRWAPDILANVHPMVLSKEAIDAVAKLPGIVPGQSLPLTVEQPQLAQDLTDSQDRASVTRQDNIVLIGFDPDAALGGNRPLFQFDFIDGDRLDAAEKLKKGPYCIVPDHFLRETGLNIGDGFAVLPLNDPAHPVEYRIAATVSLPGWHWLSKVSGLRLNAVRSAAMVFVDDRRMQRDFGLEGPSFLWFNVQPGVTDESLQTGLQAAIQGASADGSSNRRVEPVRVRLSRTDGVADRVRGAADRTISRMSQLPLITLAITSLGVVNAILGSVRARRWEMGVLISLGYTRSMLLRLILAEGLLLGVAACLLSLGFGIMAGWCGSGISQYVSFFGGMQPPLLIPWAKLTTGIGAALLLCLIASLWPALQTGRKPPLQLLQAGRATF